MRYKNSPFVYGLFLFSHKGVALLRKPSRRTSGQVPDSHQLYSTGGSAAPAAADHTRLSAKIKSQAIFASETCSKVDGCLASKSESERKFLAGEFDSVFSCEARLGEGL